MKTNSFATQKPCKAPSENRSCQFVKFVSHPRRPLAIGSLGPSSRGPVACGPVSAFLHFSVSGFSPFALCPLPSAIRKQSSARVALPVLFLAAGLALALVFFLRARATDLQITGVTGTTNRQANFL